MILRIACLVLLFSAAELRSAEPDLSGRWSGHWRSETTGHDGPLNARFKRTDATHYRVVFTGSFFKVIPFRYAQTLNVTGTDGNVVYLSGSSRLLGFGNFCFDASATGCQFRATYSSRNDRGEFVLSK